MNAYVLLLGECLASLATSLVVLAVLSRPLVDVLARICPDEQAAAFWLSYSKVMLTIAPLLLVLATGLLSPFTGSMAGLRLTMIATLGGLLIGLQVIGRRLGRYVAVPPRSGGLA